jgi:hypothetical protein
LARRLGLVDAIAIGLGSMIGAGVRAFAPAAAAGSGLLIGLTRGGGGLRECDVVGATRRAVSDVRGRTSTAGR